MTGYMTGYKFVLWKYRIFLKRYGIFFKYYRILFRNQTIFFINYGILFKVPKTFTKNIRSFVYDYPVDFYELSGQKNVFMQFV